MSCDTAEYMVYGLNLLDGLEVTGMVASLGDCENACNLARYCLSLGMCKAEVFEREKSGIYSLVYSCFTGEYDQHDTLESLRQLRQAGALMPDPEDSPLFATPCAPFEKV